MIVFQLLLAVSLSYEQEPVCREHGVMKQPELYADGDLIIGGIFSFRTGQDVYVDAFTSVPEARPCQEELQFALTMVFAVEEINQNPDFLQGYSLGYKIYDSCGSLDILRSSLALVSGNLSLEMDKCKSQTAHAIIGHSGSTPTIAIARTLGQFHIPVISHFASCACLSNRKDFPSFFRTIPSDYYQSRALAQLVKHFGWTWVGTISNGNDYGLNGISMFIKAALEEGVCIEYSAAFEITSPHQKILQIVETIKRATSKVIMAFMSHREIKILVGELHKQNITGLQWIGSDAWITDTSLTESLGHEYLIGSIGFTVPRVTIPNLGPFLEKVNPMQFPSSMFIKDFWESVFNCSLRPRKGWRSCNGSEHLKYVKNSFTDVSDLRFTNNVYKAVYAVGHALHMINACNQSKYTFTGSNCTDFTQIQPREVLYSLQNVNFTIRDTDNVFFTGDGDSPAKYELINLQSFSEGTTKVVTVGYYDASVPKELQLTLNGPQIVWTGSSRMVPESVCSESCLPGTRRAAQNGRPACCFDCIPCAPGEISNTTDSPNCLKCPVHYWSNTRGDACIPKEVEFLSYTDIMGILLAFFGLLGVLFTILTIFIFYYHKDTPIVRANNSELSFLLLFSLTLCFLSSLTFIGQPSDWSCMLRHTAFGITFVLCISCVLGKTIVVLMAFRATLPGSNVMKWFGPPQQRMSVISFTLIQVFICVVWVKISPPFPYMNMDYYQDKTLFECHLGSSVGFWAVLGYIGFLAVLCFILAFLARKLPDNFNEAKFITFSMLIFCAVWITFIPAYVSSPGKFTVAVEIFAILASSYSLLLCIFLPKCYIMLLKPEMNTKKQVMGKGK